MTLSDDMERRAWDRRFPLLTEALAIQLSAIPQTDDLYYPCIATLRDGAVLDCVYLAEARPWFRAWGVWPQEDAAKRFIDLNEVVALSDSPSRLPPRFANELYRSGESGMGYTIFTVRFRDGSSMAVSTGNAVDFVDFPPGQSPQTITAVFPHVGRDDPGLRPAPHYRWCLFERPFSDD